MADSYLLNLQLVTENKNALKMSGGELLKIWLLNSHLLNTFGSKSTAWHEIDQLLKSS